MTKSQADDLSAQLVIRKIAHTEVYSLDSAGADVWSIQLDAARTYTGAELGALVNYCTQKNLVLTVIFSTIGVV